jgi:hypothetical protein
MTAPHFARPLPVDGKTPTHGRPPCATCGLTLVRKGREMGTDGVRGHWVHQAAKPVAPTIATDRQEHEACEAGTPGCCIAHGRNPGPCETW